MVVFHVDWDHDEQAPWRNGVPLVRGFRIEERRSPNGRWHYRLTTNEDLPISRVFVLRYLLGDDQTRIMADVHRAQMGQRIDVLYDEKAGKRPGPWQRIT